MAAAMLGIVSLALSGLVKYVGVTVSRANTAGMAQEDSRRALMLIEESLVYANEVRTASSTYVEFTADIDRAPAYDRNSDSDGDGAPDFRDGDRDNDVQNVLPAAVQWRGGYNLKDDDEDGDARIDMMGRLYLSSRTLVQEIRVNEGAWTSRRVLLADVSSFTLTYWGNRANPLGQQIDVGPDGASGTADAGESDGVVSAAEMDAALAPLGAGNRNGRLDLAAERRYITSIRLYLAVDRNQDGKNDYAIETDVYPPLLPLKSR